MIFDRIDHGGHEFRFTEHGAVGDLYVCDQCGACAEYDVRPTEKGYGINALDVIRPRFCLRKKKTREDVRNPPLDDIYARPGRG